MQKGNVKCEIEPAKVSNEVEPKLVTIVPRRNHVIKQNHFFYNIKKGESIQVAEQFIAALKTEKVID